jgi:hypothetical protein
VTIPATLTQRSEIPEGLMNYPMYIRTIYFIRLVWSESITRKAWRRRKDSLTTGNIIWLECRISKSFLWLINVVLWATHCRKPCISRHSTVVTVIKNHVFLAHPINYMLFGLSDIFYVSVTETIDPQDIVGVRSAAWCWSLSNVVAIDIMNRSLP